MAYRFAESLKKKWLLPFIVILGFIPGCDRNSQNDAARDIWDPSTPEAQGMDRRILDSAFSRAKSTGFTDCLLVIRNGFIVAEQYYNGYDESRPHDVMSVSKSFLSAITGIACHRGYIRDLDEKILNYFPEYIYSGMDSRKYDITIRHLLTMRMGIQNESDDNYGAYWEFYHSSNWIQKTIESPLAFNPGEKMSYNTFQTHLLAAIITRATQKSLWDFATESLFEPMKIDVDSWERDPQGYFFGGNSMCFTPREMAVLGSLYLHGGMWNDVQIVPEDWVRLTLSPSTDLKHPNEWGAFKNYNYAYLWWLGQVGGRDMFLAYGYGGQFVAVFPGLNLIIVSTAANRVAPEMSTVQEQAIFEIMASSVLPSVVE